MGRSWPSTLTEARLPSSRSEKSNRHHRWRDPVREICHIYLPPFATFFRKGCEVVAWGTVIARFRAAISGLRGRHSHRANGQPCIPRIISRRRCSYNINCSTGEVGVGKNMDVVRYWPMNESMGPPFSLQIARSRFLQDEIRL